jgi:glycosyltransferase involved in cell wall biosynthesis/Tfp pilus assembly protein PilF
MSEGNSEASQERVGRRIGIVTTWNQRCGLATYAEYTAAALRSSSNVIILAESTSDRIRGSDESFVKRCWRRPRNGEPRETYAELEREVISSAVEVLHLNFHSGFYEADTLLPVIERLRARGIVVILQPHTLFTIDDDVRKLISAVNGVIVHSPESALEAVALGGAADSVFTVDHGIVAMPSMTVDDARRVRQELEIPPGRNLITTVGFIHPHKGMEGVLEALLHLKNKGVEAHGLIMGELGPNDPNAAEYLEALKRVAREHGLEDQLTIMTGFVGNDTLMRVLSSSDLVMLNYRSQHYESSGIASLAVASGAVVACSLAPAFQRFGGAVWHMTAGYPPGLSAELLLTNQRLRNAIRDNARRLANEWSWPNQAQRFAQIYDRLFAHSRPVRTNTKENANTTDNKNTSRLTKENQLMVTQSNQGTRKFRILMQNRANALTHPGGDTVVMLKLKTGLEQCGAEVTLDLDASVDPRGFDLVHMFNFALPQLLRPLAERCVNAGVPYVVTTLYEDVPRFHNQSHAMGGLLVEYVNRGQNAGWWEQAVSRASTAPNSERFENRWVAERAAALFTNGSAESKSLRRDYGELPNIVEVRLGHEVGARCGPEMFQSQYGVSDFIFCVGRIETRKNQLMLLKAMEQSEIPVVLASGSVCYQPDYLQAVRSFKRKGQTIILDRVSSEMLSSAYAACRVHALVSWYELPGLVTLEAASHGRNVVATRAGTIPDYMGNECYYARPDDEDSIRNAVIAGYYSPVRPSMVDLASSFTWERMTRESFQAYERIIGRSARASSDRSTATVVTAGTGAYDMISGVSELQDLIDKGELAAKSLDFEAAHHWLGEAEQTDSANWRVLKARGAVFLAEGKVSIARGYFDRALKSAPNEPKVLSGCGMCCVMEHRPEEAWCFFNKALSVDPMHTVAAHHIFECAKELGRYAEAAAVLRQYTVRKPAEIGMKVKLAECLEQSGSLDEARATCSEILAAEPENTAAAAILGRLRRTAEAPAPAASTPQPPVSEPGGLSDLAARVSAWRISSASGTSASQAPAPASATPQAGAPVAPTSAAAPPAPMQSGNPTVERFLGEAEEAKRARKLDDAHKRCNDSLGFSGISPGQRYHALSLKAELHVLEGQLKEAEQIYDQVLASEPSYPRALCGKGALAAEANRWPEARSFFERALRSDPEYDIALSGLGVECVKDGKLDEAFEFFSRALKRNPENNRAILGMLQVGYPTRRFADIEQAIRNYLDFHPVNIDMQYSLAGVLFAQQKVDEARQEVEKILIFDPNNARARELQERIRDVAVQPGMSGEGMSFR